MSWREDLQERLDRRAVAIVLLVLLPLLGVGLGTLTDGPDGPGADAVVPVTPSDPPEDPPGDTQSPTDGDTSAPDQPTPPPTGEPPSGDDGGTGDGGDGAGSGADGDGGGEAGASGGGGGDDGDGESPLTLRAVGSGVILQYDDLEPSDGDRDSIVLRNDGDVTARLDVANVTVEDEENGVVSAESSVDTPGNGGELSEHVMLVVEVEYPDGSTENLYDTDQGARSLAAIAAVGRPAEGSELAPGEDATVTFDWQVPTATGNVIQSDGANVTVDFRLQST